MHFKTWKYAVLFTGAKWHEGALQLHIVFSPTTNIYFFNANAQESIHVKNCLMQYEKTSGQVINFEKTAITFSPSVPENIKAEVWNKRFLSRAGKEVLLKSIIQAIPSYVMSVFLLPTTMCEEIERMMNAFWWGGIGPQEVGFVGHHGIK